MTCASHCHIYLAHKPLSTEIEGSETQDALVAVVPGKRGRRGGGKVVTWLILCIFGKKKWITLKENVLNTDKLI